MSPLKQSQNLAARMGRWSAGHWKTAVFGWLAFVVAALFIGALVGTKQIENADSNVGESHRADKILQAGFPQADPQTEIVLVQSKTQTVKDPAFRAAVRDVERSVAGNPEIKNLRSPLAAANDSQISSDGHAVLVQWDMRGTYDHATTKIDRIQSGIARVADRHPGIYVGEAGAISSGKALDKMFNDQLKLAGERSIPITILILLLVFGALVAVGVPLLLALSGVAATIGLVSLPSQIVPMDPNVSAVVLLIGLAVGVDYSLFYLKREREERAAGRSAHAALEAAAATSGRSVLISGLTVMVAMAGMVFSGDKSYLGFGIATMMVVGVAMLGSLTVLPALLSRLGDKVEKGKIPFLHRLRRNSGENRMWKAILRPVLRRPALAAAISGAALLALAVPVLHLHTSESGLDSIPKSAPTIATLDRIQTAFSNGDVSPAIVAVKTTDTSSEAAQSAITELESRAVASGQMHGPISVDTNASHTIARVTIPLAGKGTDNASNAALRTLRTTILPQTIGLLPGTSYAVTGPTASSVDQNTLLKNKAPLVFGFVLIFAFLLLLVSFRSIVIPVKAIVLNLLSVGAAYGVLVIIFQWGWGESLLNFKSNGGIASWLPIFMFVILFGLSMDYHVFILSRVREAYDRGMKTADAVEHGITTTAGVVSSAALVMVGAFAVFALMPIIDMKEMGIGLAVAVLLDATIVRAVLLPATMKMLGDWNWYLPRWLEWLPRLEHEGGERVRDEVPQAAPVLGS
ncbi:MAG: heme transporter [Gaiellaceae bacterium]|nr:heme transporter [Gaiellaceae bacterium]